MEIQKKAFHSFHPRLEIAKPAISTFPPPPPFGRFSKQTSQKQRPTFWTMEKWKSNTRIPTFPPSRPGPAAQGKSHPVFGCAIPFKPIQSNSQLTSFNLNTLLPMSSE
jgi:hypothetical protein